MRDTYYSLKNANVLICRSDPAGEKAGKGTRYSVERSIRIYTCIHIYIYRMTVMIRQPRVYNKGSRIIRIERREQKAPEEKQPNTTSRCAHPYLCVLAICVSLFGVKKYRPTSKSFRLQLTLLLVNGTYTHTHTQL